MTEEAPKTLDEWASSITQSKSKWLAFYAEMLGTPVSSIPKFYRAVNLYGFFPVFEAIVDSSTRELNGDPLAYVVKVSANKWREEQESRNEENTYANAIEQSKKASDKANKDLERRLKRKRK